MISPAMGRAATRSLLEISSAVVLAVAVCAAMQAQLLPTTNYDEAKVGTYTLPDPLVFNNGKAVRNAHDWKRRRREILELFQENVYGFSPRSRKAAFAVVESGASALSGKAIRRQVTIYFSSNQHGLRENLLIYLPRYAPKPVPLFLTLNFAGSQSVINDPGIRLLPVWDWKTHLVHEATEDSRGRDQEFAIEKILARGYGFATICYQDIEPDFQGGYIHGIRPLFFKRGQTEPGPRDWGAIGAWAYGLSRAMDYLEQDKDVDARRVAIMGHSRLGKTVLWAGALDTRFAVVISSCSGEGGASLARRNYGETIRNLTDVFPYWFDANYKQFADHADRLPVDTHELIALIAPRPVYVTGAEDDKWGDPKGEFLACVAAGPVFRLLGGQDLGTSELPPLNQPIIHTLAYHIRSGKHEVTAFDWDQFLLFADKYLRAQ